MVKNYPGEVKVCEKKKKMRVGASEELKKSGQSINAQDQDKHGFL